MGVLALRSMAVTASSNGKKHHIMRHHVVLPRHIHLPCKGIKPTIRVIDSSKPAAVDRHVEHPIGAG